MYVGYTYIYIDDKSYMKYETYNIYCQIQMACAHCQSCDRSKTMFPEAGVGSTEPWREWHGLSHLW